MSERFDKQLFYDNQLNSTELTWRLYPSNGEKYVDKPILRGIIDNPNFGISGQHFFGDPQGALAGVIKSIFDAVKDTGQDIANSFTMGRAIYKSAPESLQEGIDNLVGQRLGGLLGSADSQSSNSSLATAALTVAKNIGEKLQNTNFISGFDYVKMFQGTNLGFIFPQLTTRVYYGNIPDYIGMDDSDVTNKNSVIDYVNKVMRRFSGTLSKVGSSVSNDDELIQDSIDTVNSLMGIQTPPNGYAPRFTNIDSDKPITGTFKLEYGSHTINNLLVESFNIEVSTIKAIILDNDGNPIISDQPLYADISASVIPCTYVSRAQILTALGVKKGTTKPDSWDSKYNFNIDNSQTAQAIFNNPEGDGAQTVTDPQNAAQNTQSVQQATANNLHWNGVQYSIPTYLQNPYYPG